VKAANPKSEPRVADVDVTDVAVDGGVVKKAMEAVGRARKAIIVAVISPPRIPAMGNKVRQPMTVRANASVDADAPGGARVRTVGRRHQRTTKKRPFGALSTPFRPGVRSL